MDVREFLNKLPNDYADLVIADPPYNIKIDTWDNFSDEDYWIFMHEWIDLVIEKVRPGGSIYLFNNAFNSALIVSYLKDKNVDYKNWIVWYKKDGFSPSKTKYVNNQETILYYTKKGNDQITFNYDDIRVPYESSKRMEHAKDKGILKNGKRWYPNSKGKLCTDVWEFSSHRHKAKVNGVPIKSDHPTPKPEDLVERMILASSRKNDIVLDLFSGTGTTAYLAKKHGRTFLGCEINSDYIQIIDQKLKEAE